MRAKIYHKWTVEDEHKLQEMRAAGCSVAEIKEEIGCSHKAVIGKTYRMGLGFPNPIGRKPKWRG